MRISQGGNVQQQEDNNKIALQGEADQGNLGRKRCTARAIASLPPTPLTRRRYTLRAGGTPTSAG